MDARRRAHAAAARWHFARSRARVGIGNMEDVVVDRSGLDAPNRNPVGNGTRRRSLLVGGPLGALGLARGADTTPRTSKTKRNKAAAPKMLWAVVDSGGQLAYGSGVSSVKKHQGHGASE